MDQTANIVGARPAPAITRSDYTPVDMLAGLAADLCRSPAARNVPIPAIGLNLADQSWGDRLSPQMRCLNGVAGSAEVVSLGGIAGSGILVIQDAAVVASGSFRWEGLVLVSGANVGFAVTGEQNTDIVGALLINERAAASERTLPSLALRGAARILYSHTALSVAANLIPDEILATSYAALPSTVSQSYWRVIGR